MVVTLISGSLSMDHTPIIIDDRSPDEYHRPHQCYPLFISSKQEELMYFFPCILPSNIAMGFSTQSVTPLVSGTTYNTTHTSMHFS